MLVDDAMLSIVKTILSITSQKGITGDHSFYISFKTKAKGVVLSSSVKKKYPREITIVLQYQFKDLTVFDDRFSVNLSFNGPPETIIVPFASLTSFIDPIANFSLQFDRTFEHTRGTIDVNAKSNQDSDNNSEIKQMKPKASIKKASMINSSPLKEGKVIAIDKFRKKRK